MTSSNWINLDYYTIKRAVGGVVFLSHCLVGFVEHCMSLWPVSCLTFDLWLLVTPLASVLYDLWSMTSGYPFGQCLIYGFWLPLWYLVCPFGQCLVWPLIYGFWLPLWPVSWLTFDLWLLDTPLVSSNFSSWIYM